MLLYIDPADRSRAMKKPILVRHCQSEHYVNGLTGGWTDTPLTELGREHAVLLAGRVRQEIADGSCVLFTSDLKRAAETAAYIGGVIGKEPVTEPGLREFNNGIAAGLTETEAAKIRAPEPSVEGTVDYRPFAGGETWREFYARVAACLERLVQAEQENVILVAHGGTVLNTIAWWLYLDADALARVSFRTSPGGITVLTTNRWNERVLDTLSSMEHLH
jgi:probable phosphoglycerate mutase